MSHDKKVVALTDEETARLAREISWLTASWAGNGKDPERLAQALAFAETIPCLRTRASAVMITRASQAGSKRHRFMLDFSRLPGKPFGPYGTGRAVQQLLGATLLTAAEARSLIREATEKGCATRGYS